MESSIDSRSQYTKLVQSWDYNYPELIYHYTSPYIAMEKILTGKEIRFSSIKKLNDPKESKPSFKIENLRDENENKIVGIDEFFYYIYLDHTKLFCCSISDKPDNNGRSSSSLSTKGFAHQRMWAQYAHNHTGICFAFNRERLLENVNEKDYYKVLYSKIDYSHRDIERNGIATIDHSKLTKYGTDKYLVKFAVKNKKLLFFTKYPDWKQENEYRIVLLCKYDEEDTYVKIDNSLEAIILGSEFPEVYKPSIIEVSKKEEVDLFQIEWENGIAKNLRIINGN